MSANGTRNEQKCRNTASVDGTFCPRISKQTAERLTRFCKIVDMNRTKYVEYCINAGLDVDERAVLEQKTKEELIELLLNGGIRCNSH